MDLQLVSTDAYFPYPFYLAVISALQTQNVNNVNLWATQQPEGKFFDKIKDRIRLNYIEIPDFPSLCNKDRHFKAALQKDYIEWKVLYENGGVFLDLDTFSLKDISYLLDLKDIVTSPYRIADFTPMGIGFNSFEGAILVAKPKSIIIKETLDNANALLMNDDIVYGYTGPIIYSSAIQRHLDLVKFVPLGTFGEVFRVIFSVFDDKYMIAPFREDGILGDNTHIYHLYASRYQDKYYNIDKEYVADGNTLLARLVRETLSRKDWYV